MANRKRRLGRRLADASLGELRRQLTYKTTDHGHQLVAVGRFFPSSKTCSACGEAKPSSHSPTGSSDATSAATSPTATSNAARTIAKEAVRLLKQDHQQPQQTIRTSPGYDRETQNADRRQRKTREAQANLAAVA